MKATALLILILGPLPILAQSKPIKAQRQLNTKQTAITKTDTSGYIGLSAFDSLRQLKPPPGGPGGGTPPFYGYDAIQALITEAGEKYNNGFTSTQITEYLKSTYNLSLAQATRVMYHAYYFKFKNQDVYSDWCYVLQGTISDLYKSNNKFTHKLLKEGGETYYLAFQFFYFHFIQVLSLVQANREFLITDHYKLYIDAGYSPEEVYTKAVRSNLVLHERIVFEDFFLKGMKKANVSFDKMKQISIKYGLNISTY